MHTADTHELYWPGPESDRYSTNPLSTEQVISDAISQDKTWINLDGRRLEEIPKSIFQLKNLRGLKLSGNSLSNIPEEIYKLDRLEHLNLSSNFITEVPQAIHTLPNLKYLDLSNNLIATLPSPHKGSKTCLSGLQALLLHTNNLKKLPSWLRELTELVMLCASANPLVGLPDSLRRLKSIEYLTLAQCELSSIPTCIRDWRKLKHASFGNNPLTEVPEWIGQLSELEGLDLGCTKHTVLVWQPFEETWRTSRQNSPKGLIQRLPDSMKQLSKLQELYLHGHKKLGIPPAIIGEDWNAANNSKNTKPQNARSILDYLFQTQKSSKKLNESKLILVGRGGTGKTCILKRLVHNTFNEKEPETPGIEIQQWPISLEDGDNARLHIWDFGGQEILHATHQFFFTENSLYLLVISGREGNSTADAEYWLQLIKSFGGDSPVIIALNKSHQHPFDLNRGLLLEKYPFIVDFIKTDCKQAAEVNIASPKLRRTRSSSSGGTPKTDTSVPPQESAALGISLLKQKIIEQTGKMEHRNADFPAGWFSIKEKLSGMKNDFVSWEQYQTLCSRLGENDAKAQRDLAKYLHILGIALNYADDPRLHDTRVLNPRWVTEGIYALLRVGQREQRGVLTMADVASALDPKRYPASKHDFILRLMERFQLCFRLPGTEERYLVPELLSDNQPNLNQFFNTQGLRFRYQYQVLPEGILPRFIVQTHVLSEKQGHLRWRSGVVLERNGCMAVVRADIRERRIDVMVSGPGNRQRSLLEIIRQKLEEQHQDYKGLEVDERVPIPDEPDVTISFKHLLTLEEEGEISCRPEGARKTYRIADLLNGVESPKQRANRRTGSEQSRTIESTASPLRNEVFISYSHRDNEQLEEFQTMLAPAIRANRIKTWSDQRIQTGDKWRDEIEDALSRARMAVLLVSKNFLASKFITEHELPPILAAAKENGLKIYWIYLASCLYKTTEIASYQAAHEISKPLSLLGRARREVVVREICEKLIEDFQAWEH